MLRSHKKALFVFLILCGFGTAMPMNKKEIDSSIDQSLLQLSEKFEKTLAQLAEYNQKVLKPVQDERDQLKLKVDTLAKEIDSLQQNGTITLNQKELCIQELEKKLKELTEKESKQNSTIHDQSREMAQLKTRNDTLLLSTYGIGGALALVLFIQKFPTFFVSLFKKIEGMGKGKESKRRAKLKPNAVVRKV